MLVKKCYLLQKRWKYSFMFLEKFDVKVFFLVERVGNKRIAHNNTKKKKNFHVKKSWILWLYNNYYWFFGVEFRIYLKIWIIKRMNKTDENFIRIVHFLLETQKLVKHHYNTYNYLIKEACILITSISSFVTPFFFIINVFSYYFSWSNVMVPIFEIHGGLLSQSVHLYFCRNKMHKPSYQIL